MKWKMITLLSLNLILVLLNSGKQVKIFNDKKFNLIMILGFCFILPSKRFLFKNFFKQSVLILRRGNFF